MKRFFFHVHHGSTVVRDREGCVLASSLAARQHSVQLSMTLLRIVSGPLLMKSGLADFTIEIEEASAPTLQADVSDLAAAGQVASVISPALG